MPGPSRASAALDFLHGVPHPLFFLSLFCVLLGLECCFLPLSCLDGVLCWISENWSLFSPSLLLE